MYLKDKDKQLNIRLSVDDYDELVALADNNGITVSALVRLMIVKYLAFYNSPEERDN